MIILHPSLNPNFLWKLFLVFSHLSISLPSISILQKIILVSDHQYSFTWKEEGRETGILCERNDKEKKMNVHVVHFSHFNKWYFSKKDFQSLSLTEWIKTILDPETQISGLTSISLGCDHSSLLLHTSRWLEDWFGKMEKMRENVEEKWRKNIGEKMKEQVHLTMSGNDSSLNEKGKKIAEETSGKKSEPRLD